MEPNSKFSKACLDLFKDICIATAMEDRGNVCLWSKGQVCLFQYNKNNVSFLGLNQVGLQSIIKDLDFLNLSFLFCNNPKHVQALLGISALALGIEI